METSFFGRAVSRSHKLFSLPLDYFFWMRSWRNAWHHQLGSRKEVLNANTQITNLFILAVLVRWKSLFFIFLDPTSSFLLEWMETHIFWARPFKIAQAFFSSLGLLFWMRSWRNAWHHQHGSRKEVLNVGKKFVIELYVIWSWWKIKFQNKREIHQLGFFSFTPVLNNLNKLDFCCNLVALLQ